MDLVYPAIYLLYSVYYIYMYMCGVLVLFYVFCLYKMYKYAFVFISSVAPLARPPLLRNSSLCRSRRSLLSHQASIVSADPDLLSMASAPGIYRPEPDDEHIFFSVDAKRYSLVPYFCFYSVK